MLLTIAIPTTYDRQDMFDNLVAYLYQQIGDNPVEVIYCCDNKEISVGAKRQLLIEQAKGEYIFMCDSDDWVSEDYIDKVLKALETKPDCVTYLEHISYNGSVKSCCHSNKYDDWGENKDGFHYIRTPYFKDVIKTDICRKIGVKDMRYSEDIVFARDLKKSALIRSEVHIPEYMYYYSQPVLNDKQLKERYGIK